MAANNKRKVSEVDACPPLSNSQSSEEAAQNIQGGLPSSPTPVRIIRHTVKRRIAPVLISELNITSKAPGDDRATPSPKRQKLDHPQYAGKRLSGASDDEDSNSSDKENLGASQPPQDVSTPVSCSRKAIDHPAFAGKRLPGPSSVQDVQQTSRPHGAGKRLRDSRNEHTHQPAQPQMSAGIPPLVGNGRSLQHVPESSQNGGKKASKAGLDNRPSVSHGRNLRIWSEKGLPVRESSSKSRPSQESQPDNDIGSTSITPLSSIGTSTVPEQYLRLIHWHCFENVDLKQCAERWNAAGYDDGDVSTEALQAYLQYHGTKWYKEQVQKRHWSTFSTAEITSMAKAGLTKERYEAQHPSKVPYSRKATLRHEPCPFDFIRPENEWMRTAQGPGEFSGAGIRDKLIRKEEEINLLAADINALKAKVDGKLLLQGQRPLVVEVLRMAMERLRFLRNEYWELREVWETFMQED